MRNHEPRYMGAIIRVEGLRMLTRDMKTKTCEEGMHHYWNGGMYDDDGPNSALAKAKRRTASWYKQATGFDIPVGETMEDLLAADSMVFEWWLNNLPKLDPNRVVDATRKG